MNSPPTEQEDAPTVAVATSMVRPSSAAVQPGLRIGAYRLQRALGAGGMGEVWLAEQLEPVRRPVALKLMQRQLLNPLSEAYFEVERQALARMDHPAIAKVFDAGRTADGQPWLVMEWIDGQPLLAWCRDARPDLPTRLRVLATLARGVQQVLLATPPPVWEDAPQARNPGEVTAHPVNRPASQQQRQRPVMWSRQS